MHLLLLSGKPQATDVADTNPKKLYRLLLYVTIVFIFAQPANLFSSHNNNTLHINMAQDICARQPRFSQLYYLQECDRRAFKSKCVLA